MKSSTTIYLILGTAFVAWGGYHLYRLSQAKATLTTGPVQSPLLDHIGGGRFRK